MSKSLRASDSRAEKALSIFLDRYFYPEIIRMGIISGYRREYERDNQVNGIDLVVDDSINIDEKGQVHFINNVKDSFIFEVDLFDDKHNKVENGWFIKETNKTDKYMFFWIPEARTDQLNRIVSEDYIHVQAVMLDKKVIKDYLRSCQITDSVLKKNAVKMRKELISKIDLNENCYMRFNPDRYVENPINLVVYRSKLDELSEHIFDIYKDKVSVLK